MAEPVGGYGYHKYQHIYDAVLYFSSGYFGTCCFTVVTTPC